MERASWGGGWVTLRKKLVLILGVMVALLVASFGTVSNWITIVGSARLEKQSVRTNTKRALDTLRNELDDLDARSMDWAAWDDSYRFMADRNEQYIATNLVDAVLLRNNLSVIAYVDSGGRLVYGKAVDHQTGKAVGFPRGLVKHLAVGYPLLTHRSPVDGVNGIIQLPEGVLMVSSHAIITSRNEGPARGSLIMGRFLDAGLIEKWGRMVHLPISVVQLDSAGLPDEYRRVRKALLAGSDLEVQALNEETIAGYARVKDIYGRPALAVRITVPRSVYRQEHADANRLIWFLCAGGLLTLAVSVWLFEKMILSRLTSLTHLVDRVGETGNLALRSPVYGSDELSRLTRSINAMFSALERARNLQESEQRHRALAEELSLAQQQLIDILDCLPVATFVLGRDRKVIAWNRALEELTGVPKEDIVNQGDFAYAIPLYGHRRPLLVDQLFREEGEPLAPEYAEAEQRGRTLYLERFMPSVYGGRGAFMGIAASPLLDGEERLVGAVQSLHDLTQREQLEKQLKYLHDHDPLTGFYNRAYLMDQIHLMAERGVETLGFIRCSVDGLKLINQNLGDEAGDRLLIAVASVLERSFGLGALLARVGGSEFVVLLPEADDATVESGRLRIQQVLAEHNQLSGGVPLKLSLECCVTSPTAKIG